MKLNILILYIINIPTYNTCIHMNKEGHVVISSNEKCVFDRKWFFAANYRLHCILIYSSLIVNQQFYV